MNFSIPNETKSNTTALINGIIKNAKSEEIKIKEQGTKIDKNGSFRIEFNLELPNYYSFRNSNQEFILYLAPGDSLNINFDTENLDNTLHFSGKGCEINTYLKSAFLLREKIFNHKKHYSLSENEFIEKIASIKTQLENNLNQHIHLNPNISKYFIEIEKKRLIYDWACIRIKYLRFHRKYTKDYSFMISDNYFDYSKKLDFNNSDLMRFDFYKEFLNDYVYDRSLPIFEKEPRYKDKDNIVKLAKIDMAIRTFTDDEIRNTIMYRILQNQIYTMGVTGIEEMVELFNKYCTNTEYVSDINTLYKRELENRKNHLIKQYKKIGNIVLDAHIFYPSDSIRNEKLPAILIFHGGGWDFGKAEWAFGYCNEFTKLGMVAISIQYRLCSRHQVTPIASISDAKSAIRWVRQNAEELNIDSNKIVTFGWSAGGHIAACAGIIKKFDESNENLSISSVPNAMMFLYTPLDLRHEYDKDGWFEYLLKGKLRAEECSPAHHIRKNLPPSIIFHGTNDGTVPFDSVEKFAKKMKKKGNRCDLHAFKGRDHLFTRDQKDNEKVLKLAKEFLISLGYLVVD